MPSSNKAYQAMNQLLQDTGSGPIVDLGSGWGNFVLRLAKQMPQRQIIGYELSLLPWLTSVILKKLLGLSNLSLHRQNFLDAELPAGATLVCYLFPGAMEKISNKLGLGQRQGDYLISNNFALPNWPVDKMIRLDDFFRSPVYRYNIKAHPTALRAWPAPLPRLP